jgi:hypothetical protein
MKKLRSILSSIGKSSTALTKQIFAAYDEKNYLKAFELSNSLTANQMVNDVRRNGMSLIYQSVTDCNFEALRVFSKLDCFREVIH